MAWRSPAAMDGTGPAPVLTQLARSALLLFLIGASAATALQYASYGKVARLVANNEIASADRRLILLTACAAGLATWLPALGYLLWRRRRSAVDQVLRVAHILSPGLLAVAVPLLFNWRVFKDKEMLGVVVAALFGLGLERTIRTSLHALPLDAAAGLSHRVGDAVPRLRRWLPAVLVGSGVLFFGIYFSYYTIQHHYRLQTQSWDLAIFDNMMWNLIRGHWFKASPDLGRTGSHIQYHATFNAYLLAPIYALRQKADTLLVIQAAIAGAGAIPLYLIVKKRLGSAWLAVLFAYAYLIYAPLHGPVFYDFHFLTLAPFFIGWVLYLFETGRRGWLIAAWIAALLLREDQSATLAMACLFYLLCGDRPRWALAGGILSAVYFVGMKFLIMPLHRSAGPDKETFSWIFSGLIPQGEHGFGAVLRTVTSNPAFTLESLLLTDKFTYVLKLLAPLLFLPLRNGRTWILLVIPAMFTLLSTGYKPLIETYFQYTANWSAFVFFAAAAALSAWKGLPDSRIRVTAAVFALAVTSTAMSYNHGAIFQHNTFRGGFRNVKFEVTDEDRQRRNDLYSLIAMIPKDASVAATETEAPHVSNREDCFTMRFGYDDADYLLVSTNEARGGRSKGHMEKALATGQYGFIASSGKFALWGRGHSMTNNDEGARLLGLRPSTR